ncbi:MAG: sporulation integral membrane protein YtvI [Erysipelotrichaceae bacterium]|nr:sporulation integral membrane protein YtvI [Erysipelotrichaceae bacterium]MCI9312628.1 sporulation integral membrane protein YtvI [Erysipelotrichaceae bacterium]
MNTERERAVLIHILYWGLIIFTLYYFFRYLLYELLPFVLGFLIAFSLRPLIKYSKRHLHLPQKMIALLFLILFYGTIGTALTMLTIRCFHFLSGFVVHFPSLYETQIVPMLDQGYHAIQNWMASVFPNSLIDWDQVYDQLSQTLRSFTISGSASLFVMVKDIAASLPGILISFFITLLSSIFFTLDFPLISKFIMRQVPVHQRAHFYQLRTIITDTILHYFYAYGKLMLITFLELSLGLSYLRVEHAIVIAFLISFFDIFPILGTGTILFPWIAVSLFHSKAKLALGLFIMHLIINFIRQIIEPKIVGKQLGVHPLIMLACMFFGVRLFGFLGIFLTPILVQVFCRLNEEGLIHLYR